jgi:hypothetical protein
VGTLPDRTPVIVGSGGVSGTAWEWRLADRTPVGEPLTGHIDWVNAVAVGTLPDGTSVIVGDKDHAVRMWRLPEGTPLVPPLDLSAPVGGVAIHGIVTAAGADIAVHRIGTERPAE